MYNLSIIEAHQNIQLSNLVAPVGDVWRLASGHFCQFEIGLSLASWFISATWVDRFLRSCVAILVDSMSIDDLLCQVSAFFVDTNHLENHLSLKCNWNWSWSCFPQPRLGLYVYQVQTYWWNGLNKRHVNAGYEILNFEFRDNVSCAISNVRHLHWKYNIWPFIIFSLLLQESSISPRLANALATDNVRSETACFRIFQVWSFKYFISNLFSEQTSSV